MYCDECKEEVSKIKDGVPHILSGTHIYNQRQNRIRDLIVLHRNCDPCDMTIEDAAVWHRLDRKFNPENYDDI